MIKEITPFLHASLYPNYERFDTFEQFDRALSPWMLTVDNIRRLPKEEPVRVGTKDSFLPQEMVPQEPAKMLDVEEKKPTIQEVVIPTIVEEKTQILDPSPSPCPALNVVSEVSRRETREPSSRFSPRKPDTLFWSMYIAQHGVGEFRQIGNKYMNKEIEEKTRIMEFLGANRSLQKSMKMSVATGQEIMGDLLTNRQTTLSMVPAFAMYYQSIIWLVSEESKTYLEFLPKGVDAVSDDTIHVLYRSNRMYKEKPQPEYTVETQEINEGYVSNLRQTYVKLDSAVKPLKGVGSYKVAELEALFDALGVVASPNNGQKWKKGDLYSAVLRHVELAWM